MSVLTQRVPARPILGIHPGLILAALDVTGLLIATYLAVVEVGGGLPECGPLKGCAQVAASEYSRIGGVPVAVYGVVLSLVLLTCAIAWWRTDLYGLLLAHYGLSLAGVLFEAYFIYRAGVRHRRRLRVVHVLRALARAPLRDRVRDLDPSTAAGPSDRDRLRSTLGGRNNTAAGTLLWGPRGDRSVLGGAAPIS